MRARTDEETQKVTLHLRRESKTHIYELANLGRAQSNDFGPYGATDKFVGASTHLADAAARSGDYPGQIEWEISLPALHNYEEVIYWLESDRGEHTDPFSVSALVWTRDDQGFISPTGSFPAGAELFDAKVLKDASGQIFRARVSLPLQPEDRVVGFGERFHSVDQRGEYVDAVVYEEYKGQGHRTYLSAPFATVIGSNFGFYVKTSTPSRYDVGVTDPNRLQIEVDIALSQTTCEIKGYVGNPAEILKQYISEFALPKTPPQWIYKLWASSNEWNTQSRVEREIAASIEHDIEIGVVVIEAWADESTFTVFRDAQYTPNDGSRGLRATDIQYPADGAWPDPQKMIDDLHAKEMKLVLWQIPVIKDQGEPGSQVGAMWNYAIENNLVIKDGQGDPYKVRGFWFRDALMPDLTDAKVRQWWADLHKYLVTDMGVDGFKTDGGEHAWGSDLQYLDGHSGLEKNNLFPVAYAQTFHELFRSSGSEGITFSRAGFAGSSSYPTFWAGDEDSTWEAYRASIRAGITASASGIFFWGWDIGGFSGELPTSELYLRGTAMATFCPIMQFHSEFNHHRTPSNDRSPWNIAEQSGDANVIPIFRNFTKIRTALIPYLEMEGAEAIESGRPLMAGLFFDYPKDSEIWNAKYEYMLGRYLLVCPITEPDAKSSRVYLPEGDWIDFWSKESIPGQQWIEVETPVSRIPVFIRSDAPL
ncbi:MAG TPA: TIM-barrel domain-containing protein, partial [Candidatus Nanopelagicaceae bacterium]